MNVLASIDRDANRVPIQSNSAIRTKKAVAFDGTSGNGTTAVEATLSTNLTGANNDIVYTSKLIGTPGNAITVEYIDPGDINQALAVTVVGTRIQVSLATDGAGAISSTGDDIKTEIANTPAADALVSTADKAANDGSGVVTAMVETALAGGVYGYVTLFTVTGLCALAIGGRCTENLAGATATVEVGIAGDTAALIAQTTATDVDNGEVWVDNAPGAIQPAPSELWIDGGANGVDIILTVGTADVTDGSLDLLALWRPLTDEASLVAA